MIDEALKLLRNELESYINNNNDSVDVIVSNIGMLGITQGEGLDGHIVITLVNIEEESTLKNLPAQKRPFASAAVYENPPVFLNLYVLFSCFYGDTRNETNYENALQRLSKVIRFFQSRNSFSTSSSVVSPGTIDQSKADLAELRFTMELYTLTFEQINHLWGSLGGRQVPFAMYKLRLVGITEKAVVREVPLITQIDSTHHPIVTN